MIFQYKWKRVPAAELFIEYNQLQQHICIQIRIQSKRKKIQQHYLLHPVNNKAWGTNKNMRRIIFRFPSKIY